MNNSDSHLPHDGEFGGFPPFRGGVLPADFGERLERLKELSGLSWGGFARALGVDRKQLLRWRKGVEPCGGAMLSMICFARRLEGGLEILLGEGIQMSFLKD